MLRLNSRHFEDLGARSAVGSWAAYL